MATKPQRTDLSDLMRDVEITGMTFGRGGHQIRTAITGGRRHATFMYPSKRYRRGQSGDGWTELNVHKISEVMPGRLDFLPQPCRIEAEVHGRPACTFPDFAYVDMHSRPVLAEAKMHWADFERPKALLQQAITRKGAEALGWDYEQITSTSIGSTGFLAAVDQVQAFRFANVPLRIELAVVQAVRKAGGVRIADLCTVLDEGVGRCIAFACALMVRRVVAVDLDAPISELSVVRPAPERPIAYPRIRL